MDRAVVTACTGRSTHLLSLSSRAASLVAAQLQQQLQKAALAGGQASRQRRAALQVPAHGRHALLEPPQAGLPAPRLLWALHGT